MGLPVKFELFVKLNSGIRAALEWWRERETQNAVKAAELRP